MPVVALSISSLITINYVHRVSSISNLDGVAHHIKLSKMDSASSLNGILIIMNVSCWQIFNQALKTIII